MATDYHNCYCLVCSSDILSTENFYLDKLEAHFLLKILLEIPQDSLLISQIQSSLTFLPVCKPCGNKVKQCKILYTEMMANVHTFWAIQNGILRKLHKSSHKYTPKLNKFNNWVIQCIQFVKNHNFQPFKYPFVVHDLTKLLTLPEPQQVSNQITNTNGIADEYLVPQNEQFGHSYRRESHLNSSVCDPLELTCPSIIDISETFQYKHEEREIEFENEADEESDQDYDISDPEISSEEDATSILPDFQWNPVTGKFHCVEPSCSKTAAFKRLIETHFRNEHSNSLGKKLKMSFTCDWPSCGKMFKNIINYKSHVNKHRGTPSLKCEKCGKSFYYPKGLRIHQNRNCKMEMETSTKPYSTSIPKQKRCIKNYRTGMHHCNYPLCLESFLNREEMRQHVKMHERLQGQIIPPNSNPRNIIPATITRNVSFNTVQNNEQFNHLEENSLSRSETFDEIPSSSGSSLIILNGKADDRFEDEDDDDYELSEKDTNSEEDNHDRQSSSSKSTSYPCKWPNCGKVFARKLNYQSHMNVHKGTPGFKCKKCGKSFYWKRVINSHNCRPSDEIASTSITNLRKIVNNFRDEDEMDGILCNWPGCGMRLSNKTRLSDHMDKHRGTPRQKCEQCGQLFYWRADLLKHRRREHGKKEDKVGNFEQSDGNLEDRIFNQISTSCSSDNSTILNCDKVKTNQIVIKVVRESKIKDIEKYCKMEQENSEEHLEEDSGLLNSNEDEDAQGYPSRKTDLRERGTFDCSWPGCGERFVDRDTWQCHMSRHKGTTNTTWTPRGKGRLPGNLKRI